MVTSNKLSDKKVVKMAEQKNIVVVPQRTLLEEVNEHITCPLCRGYYIDATTIVECLHSFCRSCIIKHLQVKSYCPVCEMMINSAKPNIKLDKALQDIVYKLVPGLFQREMDRRQQFYSSRPGPAATATPEQRGEDTERIIFSPEDVISFSLEYADITDADSISSKSSDSNEPQTAATTRRYLQCPAVVNISHLKKFLSMKFDIDSTQFAIDILYKRVPLPDYYTLMDIAYIYNWKRNEPMRFFYQIIDYVAIRNRLFDINRKESHFGDRKSSPTSTEDTNESSPAPNMNDHGSEASSGTDSPMLDDNNTKKVSDMSKSHSDKMNSQSKEQNIQNKVNVTSNKNDSDTSLKKNDEEEQKSQFLNSFELTAKNSSNLKTSPAKSNISQDVPVSEPTAPTKNVSSPKADDNLKRKNQATSSTPELKKLRVEIEKAKITMANTANVPVSQSNQNIRSLETSLKTKSVEGSSKNCASLPASNSPSSTSVLVKDEKKESKQTFPLTKLSTSSENTGVKRTVTGSQTSTSSPKRKPPSDITIPTQPATVQKTVSPLKIQLSRSDSIPTGNKVTEASTTPSPTLKKMPDLKPSNMASPAFPNKQPVNKVRMDLLANNSDIDRSKILPPVKSPMNAPNTAPNSGDPLKSLFDSCKINIPSSLSITLTDQKQESRNQSEQVNIDQKKNVVNKTLAAAASNTSTAHKVPSPPVHNYIQILKLPDSDSKKNNKTEANPESKLNSGNKAEGSSTPSKPPNKTSETSAKGPIPNLKPIADTKLAKQSGNFSAPITFQQTFEQQLQSMQSDKKSKLPKNKPQVPKLVPATPKALNAVHKPNNPNNKPNTGNMQVAEPKTSSALDLSTSHGVQSQLGPQQTIDKVFETMQSIANLANKQNLQSKGLGTPMSQSNIFPGISNRPLTSGGSQIRIPSTGNMNQMKPDKVVASSPNSTRQEVANKNNTLKSTGNVSSTAPSPSYPIASHSSPNTAQPSPRSQTRSPSSSPKLVIAEEKQISNSTTDQNVTQQNPMLNMQALSNIGLKNESAKAAPGPSRSGLKNVKPMTPISKMPLIRQPHTTNMKPNPMLNTSEYQALLRHQFEMNNWLKVHQRHYDNMYKNNITQPTQNDFGNKEKQ